MAKGFSVRGRGAGLRYAAKLDAGERAVLSELFAQVLDLIAPGSSTTAQDPVTPAPPPDDFEAIVAGLGSDFGAPTVPDSPGGLEDLGGRGFGGPDRDPALDRLFPAGNRTDPEAAGEFRRLTEDSLRNRKVANLRSAIAALAGTSDRVELTPPAALAFLVALTDVRLVIGDRLGLRDDSDAQRLDELAAQADAHDPALYAIMVYDFLTWLQETLATSMLPRGQA